MSIVLYLKIIFLYEQQNFQGTDPLIPLFPSVGAAQGSLELRSGLGNTRRDLCSDCMLPVCGGDAACMLVRSDPVSKHRWRQGLIYSQLTLPPSPRSVGLVKKESVLFVYVCLF